MAVMPLASAEPISFIPTAKAEAAREFYQITLGLHFVHDDGFAMVFRMGESGTMLRIVRVAAFEPATHTVLGWGVEELAAEVDRLRARSVAFLRFEGLQQDEHGIWTAPGGGQVAWFQDPDGNVLSLSRPASAI